MQKDDVIYRRVAINAIKTWGLIDGLSEGQAIEILADEEKVPSAPQKIAYLINPHPYGECSNCGQLIDIRDGYNYCPNCGYKLRGGNNET